MKSIWEQALEQDSNNSMVKKESVTDLKKLKLKEILEKDFLYVL